MQVEGDGGAEGLVAEDGMTGVSPGRAAGFAGEVWAKLRLERIGAKRAKARWAATRKRAGGEGDGGGGGEVAALHAQLPRQDRGAGGEGVRAARKAGRRRAAKAGAVRSKRCEVERV